MGAPPGSSRLRNPRVLALVAAVLLAAAIALVAVLTSSSDEPRRSSLVVERAAGPTGGPELIVTLQEERLNTRETTEGRASVRLECLDASGDVVLKAQHPWPLGDDRGAGFPHIHQAVTDQDLRSISRCRLKGATVELEGELRAF